MGEVARGDDQAPGGVREARGQGAPQPRGETGLGRDEAEVAPKNLAALQKSWSDEVKSVASGVMQGFSIVTEAPQDGFAWSAQDVVNKMRDQMSKAVQFAAQLRASQKKGLSSDLIAQIAPPEWTRAGRPQPLWPGRCGSRVRVAEERSRARIES
ncbi:hypothetical protein SMIR_01185 [Streptomyces mirabilis]|uniref:hypothetical protein n=1 Tax=Streptomyces mirabilis TaxID=68239 RepID=UPI001BAEFFB8|nr:hypothetical protein [Streptomyces mirabilis]QUW77938.1 hypothetical protein SMIR_01185 [Streptomyces mirabilis]